MTRETRVGLVVGLLFIVLFGVVLSELGPSDQPPQPQTENGARGFYAQAPVVRAPQPQPQPRRRDVELVARRARTEAQGPVTARRAAPRTTPRTTPRTAPRTAPRTTPRRAVGAGVTPSPRRAAGGGHREMTPEEFAAAHGVGRRMVRPLPKTYVTKRGDNLTAIARKFYRTPSRKAVMKIFNANRNVLRTPDSVGVGVKIVIPN